MRLSHLYSRQNPSNLNQIYLILYAFLLVSAHHPRPATESELFYRTTTPSGTITPSLPLPSPFHPEPEVDISVIVPAYNEHSRLPAMLQDAVEYLNAAHGASWELILVDDGSSDDTATVALSFAATSPLVAPGQIRSVVLSKNRGKGGAVAHGMRHARGRHIVFADADGATKFADLGALLGALKHVEKAGHGIAVGSRAHMVHTAAVVQRSFVRNFLMHSFHALLKTVGVREIHDTQCGFKLFSRAAAEAVFCDLRTEGWIFDIEVLMLAGYKGIPVVEVPINWHEVEGTKMDLVRDSVRMAWDLGVVRAGYALGVYTVGKGGPER